MQSLRNLVEAWLPRRRPGIRCAVCQGVGDRRRGHLALCRDCHEASRPYQPADPYDVLGDGD